RSQDSEIGTSSLPSLSDLDAVPSQNGDGMMLLGEWIGALSRAAAGNLMPKTVEWLEQGSHVAVEDGGRLFSSKEPLIWIYQTAGSSRFLGRSDVVIPAGAVPYPLSRSAWIELQPNSKLSVADSLVPLDRDQLGSGLDAFYTKALTCIVRGLD